MYSDVLIAGFGGQGIVFTGKLLAYAGLREGKQVVFYPSYGAEMRGGAASCTVIVSDSIIPSPIISSPQSEILMSYPAVEKFLSCVKKEGYVVVNSSLVKKNFRGKKVRILEVPANRIAEELGTVRAANMITLGVWACISQVVSLESLILSLKQVLSPDRLALLKVNENSLREGWRFASNPN
ncbi:2-oxoacid:acceptor oxidoreductase family protein [Candidatus Aerophobetes bacterium]|nr:2-oxoacid:acceptor oxidoreductase family protein [Candidatus Aerophobetes bacterium]